MKATILTTAARRYSDGKDGTLEVFIDLLGVGVKFDGEAFTSDDAMFIRDMLSVPAVDVATVIKTWSDALIAGDVVFEAGAHVPYEDLMSAQLFRNFDDAVKHAEFVSDEYSEPTIYARKVS